MMSEEESRRAKIFWPEVCVEWEAATEPARQKGIRVVNLRTGMVFSGKGGALTAMLRAIQGGAGENWATASNSSAGLPLTT